MGKKIKVEKITNILAYDPNRKIILWNLEPVKYRVALMIMPKNEVAALCQFFDTDKEAIEARFHLL